MSPHINLRRVDDVPRESSVRHYDELEESVKEQFPTLAAADARISVDSALARELGDCDLVKYTDYYEVSLS
ncbi:hypothetical protein [Natronobiforma cellulositropha]|uniref:hypothetical protein n=1 Tax=Natronobiforma cellulositropha TaxID=1679076 RepID=UPI0021D6130C|nr:hypothetical protein [Natronobiforma cellulositropha]